MFKMITLMLNMMSAACFKEQRRGQQKTGEVQECPTAPVWKQVSVMHPQRLSPSHAKMEEVQH